MVESRLKEIRRETDINTRFKRLEVHHIEAKFAGGSLDSDNTFALTLPEHALSHLLDSRLSKGTREGHLWSVRQITRRMNLAELNEFNRMLSIVQRR